RSYVWCVALSRAHPLARLKSIPLEKLAGERLVILSRKSYSEYHGILEHIFAPVSGKPRIAMECDSESSLFMEVEAGPAIALVTTVAKLQAGKRLVYRPLTGKKEIQFVGIARATKGDVTPVGERFCEILRQISRVARRPKQKSPNQYSIQADRSPAAIPRETFSGIDD